MTIYIAENMTFLREAALRACCSVPGWRVVGESASGSVTLRAVAAARPDVVILDLALRDIDGFAVAAALRRENPKLRIVAFSSYLNVCTVARLDRIGIDGFVDKDTGSIAQLLQALRVVVSGRCSFSATFHTAREQARSDPKSVYNLLSAGEVRVLSAIAKGLNDQEIGRKLGVSQLTAQTHRSRILRKLGICGTPKLTAFALSLGLGIGNYDN